MKSSTMYSLVEAARVVTEAREITLKGLKAFANDESMLDDLENDLQGAGLKPMKDYVLDQKKGTLTLKNKGAMKNRKIDNIKRIYRLKEDLVSEDKDINKTNVDKAIQHDWATHIYHPSLGEVKVESHSLTEDGTIEEYYVKFKGLDVTVPAKEAEVTQEMSHGHGPKKKKKK